jgi:hypothetical protein
MNRVRVWIAGTVAVVGAILSMVAATAAVARVQPPMGFGPTSNVTGYGYLVDRATGRCLASNWAGVVRTQPAPCHNSYQKYEVWDWLGSDSASLVNDVTGQCLEGTHRTGVRTGGCSGSDLAQNWDFGAYSSTPNGFGQLPNAWSNDATVLDSNKAGRVYLNTANGGRFQDWHASGSLADIVDVGG